MKWICFLVFLFSASISQADMSPEVLIQPEDWVVIEDQWFVELALEDPAFSKRKSERNLASAEMTNNQFEESDLPGQLSVQKEIPYTYPSTTRYAVRLKTLEELEKNEKNK